MHPSDYLHAMIGAQFEHQPLEGIHLQPIAYDNNGHERGARPSKAQGWALSGDRGFFSLPKSLPALQDIRVALLALTGVSTWFQVPCVITCPELSAFHFKGDTPEALCRQIRNMAGSIFDPDLQSEMRLIATPLAQCLSAHGRIALAAEIGLEASLWSFMDRPTRAL